MVVLSAYGVILPHRIISLVRGNMSRGRGLWIAVGVRLVFAALLWFTAPVSQTPSLFKVLAAVLFLSAVGHQMVGRPRLKKFIESLAAWPLWAIRLPCILGVLLGGFLLWSLSNALGTA